MEVQAKGDRTRGGRWARGRSTSRLAASVLHHESADVRGLGVSILPADRIKLKDIAGPIRRRSSVRRRCGGCLIRVPRTSCSRHSESDDPFVQQAARLGLGNSLKRETELVIAVARTRRISRRISGSACF